MIGKHLIIGVFVLLLLAGSVEASLGSASFMFGKNMALSYVSGQNPVLGKAIAFALCPSCAVTNEAFSALSQISPTLVEGIQIGMNPEQAALGKITQTIYQELNPVEQMIFSNVQQLAPYLQETFKDTEGFKIDIDENGNQIIKNKDGKVEAKIPKGVKVVKNGAILEFEVSDSYSGNELQIGFYKVRNLKKGNTVAYTQNKDDGRQFIELSEGDLVAGDTQIPNTREGNFILSKEGNLESANFVATKETTYNFYIPTNINAFSIKAQENSNVEFDSKLNSIKGTNLDIINYNLLPSANLIKNEVGGETVDIQFDEKGTLTVIKLTRGSYKETTELGLDKNNEPIKKELFSFSTDKDITYSTLIGGCADVQGSCVERYKDYKYVRVRAEDDSKILIHSIQGEVMGLYVDEISDDSNVNYVVSYSEESKDETTGKSVEVTKESEVMFSKQDHLLPKRDETKLPSIKYAFSEDGKSCSISFDYVINQECVQDTIATSVRDTAYDKIAEHLVSIEKTGIGTVYGKNSDYTDLRRDYKLSPAQAILEIMLEDKGICKEKDTDICVKEVRNFKGKSKKEILEYIALRQEGLSVSKSIAMLNERINSGLLVPDGEIKLGATSCIEFIQDVLEEGYSNVGETSKLTAIKKAYNINRYGLDVGKTLRNQKGQKWSMLVFSNDKNAFNDYYGLGKGDTMIKDSDKNCFNKLHNNFKFDLGYAIAKDGEHVGLLVRDPKTNKLSIIENHWTMGPTNVKTIESTPLEVWQKKWSDFVIFSPPGSFSKNDLC